MKPASAYRAPYAQRLADTCRAAAIVAPKVDPYPELARTSRALVAAVKADAPKVTTYLLGEARSLVRAIPHDDLGDAVRSDATVALNRIENMIRSNVPDERTPTP